MEQEPKSGANYPQARKEPSASSLSSVVSPHTSDSSLTSPPQRTGSQSNLLNMASPHRQSFAENLRNMPPSPRSQRHPSFTGVPPANVQDLLSLPPTNKMADPRFAGRDWRAIRLGELASLNDVKWVTMDTCVEEATMVMLPASPPSAPAPTQRVNVPNLCMYFALGPRKRQLLKCRPRARRRRIERSRGFDFRLQ